VARVAGSVSSHDISEASDRWNLPIVDELVVACCVDYGVTLHFSNGVIIRIGQPFIYRTTKGLEHLIVPEGDPVRVAPVLAICRQAVQQGFAFKEGRLELHFADNSVLSVSSSEDLEPWELTGPDGLRLVSIPGGDLAVWRTRPSSDGVSRAVGR